MSEKITAMIEEIKALSVLELSGKDNKPYRFLKSLNRIITMQTFRIP